VPTVSISNLPLNVSDLLDQYANRYGVNPNIVKAIAAVESGGNQSAISPKGAIGVMQLMPRTAAGLNVDPHDLEGNINGGVLYYSQLLHDFKGDNVLAIAAYQTNEAAVKKAGGIVPVSDGINTNGEYVSKVLSAANLNNAEMTEQFQLDIIGVDAAEPSNIVPISGIDISDSDFEELSPVIQVDTGTDPAWYDTPDLIKASTRKLNTPVTFQIFLGDKKRTALQDSTGKPVTLQLYASLIQYSKQSSHIFNLTPTRTGRLLTLWGMRPDLISGTGSTGLFMNQFGLTDFLSIGDFTELRDQVLTLFQGTQKDTKSTQPNGIANLFTSLTNEVNQIPVPGQNTTVSALDNLQQQVGLSDNALRVAAKDAFVEFLNLFTNNGVTYFQSSNFNGSFNNREQNAPTAFSPEYGNSVLQKNARNNDVLTKGYVVFNLRDSSYMGYFKSLNWTMDASKPFSWTFSFVFQVEREVSIVPVPGLY
jgi:hypothetical protein